MYTVDIQYDKDLDSTIITVYNRSHRVISSIKGNLLCLDRDGELNRAKIKAIEEFKYGEE